MFKEKDNNVEKVNIKTTVGVNNVDEKEITNEKIVDIQYEKLSHINVGNSYTFSLDSGNCQKCDNKMGNFDRTRNAKIDVSVHLPCDIDKISSAIVRGAMICRKVIQVNTQYTMDKFNNNIEDDSNLSLFKQLLSDGLLDIGESNFNDVIE